MFVGGIGGGAGAFTVKPTATAWHVRRALGVVRTRIVGHHGHGRDLAKSATLGRAPVCSDCHMNPHAGRRHRASGRFQLWHTIRLANEACPRHRRRMSPGTPGTRPSTRSSWTISKRFAPKRRGRATVVDCRGSWSRNSGTSSAAECWRAGSPAFGVLTAAWIGSCRSRAVRRRTL